MTDALSTELEYSQALVVPLLDTLRALGSRLGEVGGDGGALRTLLSCARLVASVFHSLNSPGLTEVKAYFVVVEWQGSGREQHG